MDSGARAQLQLLHRQMYVDLIRAYLPDYGSQTDLARALGVTEAYLSFLLEPVRIAGTTRRTARWTAALQASHHEIAEAFKFLKTPSEERARQIISRLCTDKDRRDVLQYHIDLARKPRDGARDEPASLPYDQAQSALITLGNRHQIALSDSNPEANRSAYLDVWTRAEDIAKAIDPLRSPVQYAQALMYRHDAAQVFNRPDLALEYARKAILAISGVRANGQEGEAAVRLQVNALLAEAVSLNTLGLRAEAMAVICQAERVPGYRHEPESWLRSFLEQQLTAMTNSRRLSIYQGEKIADHAAGLVPANVILQAGISRHLLDVYTIHATARSRRKAHQLAGQLRAIASASDSMIPLRRAQILLTLYRYYQAVNDAEAARNAFLEGMSVTRQANLFHQQQELLSAAERHVSGALSQGCANSRRHRPLRA